MALGECGPSAIPTNSSATIEPSSSFLATATATTVAPIITAAANIKWLTFTGFPSGIFGEVEPDIARLRLDPGAYAAAARAARTR
jgi:hypothetical protein